MNISIMTFCSIILNHHPMIAAPLHFVKLRPLAISDVVPFENDPSTPLLLRKSAMYQLPPNEKWLACFRGLGTTRMDIQIAFSTSPQLFRVLC
jgi:hypothetical protein